MIYLAASFAYEDKRKTEERKLIIEQAENILHHKNLSVYLPQDLQIPNAWDYPSSEWGLMVFANDVVALDHCDIVVMLSFGKENNAGAAWEVGYAYAKKKKVIVVSMTDEIESLMIQHGSYAQLKGLEQLEKYDFDKMPMARNYLGKES